MLKIISWWIIFLMKRLLRKKILIEEVCCLKHRPGLEVSINLQVLHLDRGLWKHKHLKQTSITLREESNVKKSAAELKNANLLQNLKSFILHFLNHSYHSHPLIPYFSGNFQKFWIIHNILFCIFKILDRIFSNVFSFVSKKFDTPSVKLP